MIAQNHGSIINICSTYGLVGPDQRIYENRQTAPVQAGVLFSDQGGVLGLTRYLATYYAGTNIRANALTPGGVFNNHDEPSWRITRRARCWGAWLTAMK
jgi:2-deoxy-D-gluconate 3-dehydrogenase